MPNCRLRDPKAGVGNRFGLIDIEPLASIASPALRERVRASSPLR
jgi:hypothetical protein